MMIYGVNKEHDFMDPKTVNSIIRRLKGRGDVFFIVHPAQAILRGNVRTQSQQEEELGEDTCKAN